MLGILDTMRRALPILLLLATAGCGIADQMAPTTEPTTTTTTTTVATPPVPTTNVASPDESAESPCLAGERPFARDGIISAFGGANGDAAQLSGIRWARHPGCERIVIELLTADGAPAGAVDPVGVDFDSRVGVIRVDLPDAITRSAIADSLFDGELVDGAYVVATQEGTLAVDLHIVPGSELALRAFEVDSPSRIVVDVRPDEEADPVLGAAIGSSVVLLSPMPEWTKTTAEVRGYVRGGQGDVDIAVYRMSEEPALVSETEVPTVPGGLWAEFAVTLWDLPAGVLQFDVSAQRDRSGVPAQVTIDTSDRSVPSPPDS